MDLLLASLALLLPVLLGSLFLNLIVPAATPARTALVFGNGTLLGLLLVPQLLWGLDALRIPLSFAATAPVTVALIAVALSAHLYRRERIPPTRTPAPTSVRMPVSHRLLFLLLLLLIALRTATVGLEVLWRPLFPWDATMHWATKSRVWFEHRAMVPFVSNSLWLELGGRGVFTDRHPDYPHTIPLLQVWMNLAVGRWDESLMNLPWLACIIAMGAAFHAQLRVAGLDPLKAIAFTYLLLSMPLVNIHVALAGYADLFLGATYCAALMSFHNWLNTGQRWQIALAVLFALLCTLIKDEGLPWAFSFIPAMLVVTITRLNAYRVAIAASLVAIVLSLLAFNNPFFINKVLVHVTAFHADGLAGIVQALWLHDNLHLLGYLMLASILIGLTLPTDVRGKYLGLAAALACAVGMFLFLFLFTVFGAGAANFTGVGRLYIQLAPGLLFLCALLCGEVLTRNPRPVGTHSAA